MRAMTKEMLLSIIRNELLKNPNETSLNIAKKHKIPINIVELFKRRLSKGQN
jgi:hypothetical protein